MINLKRTLSETPMPLDPTAQRFLAMASAGISRPDVEVRTAERRHALIKLMQFARADHLSGPGKDGVLPGPAGSIRFRLYEPTAVKDGLGPGLLFMHGGGFVAGSIETHDLVCRALAEESLCRVVSIDYRLAPEHPFPAAVEDALAAMAWISTHAGSFSIDVDRLGVCGDSAGATLAAIVCHEAIKAGGFPRIHLQCLICPVLDFVTPWPSRAEFASGFLIDAQTLAADFADYCPKSVGRHHPWISPLQADLSSRMPLSIIHTAECDPLRDEGNAYAERLKLSGVQVEHICHAGMVHNFHALGAVLPQGREALKQIGRQIMLAFT